MQTIIQKAESIVKNHKVNYKGTSIVRDKDYYDVTTIPVSVEKGRFGIDTYECTCKNCSILTVPLGMQSMCCYVLALAIYLNDKITIRRYKK